MKKNILLTVAATLMAVLLIGCGNNAGTDAGEASADAAASEDEKISVVTTIFPEYDWVKEIAGDNAEITMLLDDGVDLHSFQPTAEDIIKVSDCDVFIYVGGESDAWVEDALAEAVNEDMIVIDLMDVLGDSVKEEEVVEGMEAGEHEHEHEDEEEEHEDEEEHEHEEEVEYDEHVWLSLKYAEVLCESISEKLAEADPENAEIYSANAQEYIGKLSELDAEYENVVSEAENTTLLFGDRFPFRYMVDDYGLSYYAAFVGCSAETEASFETITFLANKVDELGLGAILQIESSDGKIAETIRDNTESKDQEILTLDSMQQVTAEDVEAGANYLSIMEANLEVLKQALN
ncbi:MAG: metal ABC transporter substrate-binding protein [Eubacterium sp.]|nr:metal ABC transporter substrate-binding protein [Eubacterium sp.]